MRLLACLTALAVAAPVFSATLPAAPDITTGAGFKSLRLDWEASASATYYQVYFRPHAGAAFQKLGPDLPASQTSAEFRISLHLFDWEGSRYRVSACNSAGCAAGAAVSVSAHRLDAVGYFKPPQREVGSMLGEDLDMSPNGANFIASAPQSHGEYPVDAGSALVFRRGADNQWVQRARLRPERETGGGGGFGMRVAISADGNTAAMGMPSLDSGEVYVFKYANGSWARTRIPPVGDGGFGVWIGLDDTGKTLAIKERTGFGIYKLINGSWQRSIVVHDPPDRNVGCVRGLLTRDGSTVVENCFEGGTYYDPGATYLRVHSGPAFSSRTELDLGYVAGADSNLTLRYGVGASRDGEVIAAQSFTGVAGVKVFRRTAGVYAPETSLAAGSWHPAIFRTYFGGSISISGDGRTLAIGDVFGMGKGKGVQKPPVASSDDGDPGSVYVYKRNSSTWVLASVVKPNHQLGWEGALAETFGADVALCATGATLVIGQPRDSGIAIGIGGDWRGSQTNTYSGAVWMY